MTSRLAAWLPFLLCWSLLSVGFAQKKPEVRHVQPDKFERATKADDKGLLQWAEYKPENCGSCKGSGKTACPTCFAFGDKAKHCIECGRNKNLEAACRSCAGLGHWPDPLDKVHCPSCMAAGFVLCNMCIGSGIIGTKASGDTPLACPVCREDGGWKCGTCNGERLIDAASVKPNLREANAAALQKAIAQVDATMTALAKAGTDAKDARKMTKEIGKALATGQSTLPAMKRMPKFMEDVMGKVAGGNQYQGQGEREGEMIGTFRNGADYYLKHQKRMLELAHKRAEANEKVLAEQKAAKDGKK